MVLDRLYIETTVAVAAIGMLQLSFGSGENTTGTLSVMKLFPLPGLMFWFNNFGCFLSCQVDTKYKKNITCNEDVCGSTTKVTNGDRQLPRTEYPEKCIGSVCA